VRGCGACDHCLGDTTSVDGALVIAQKILSAIARTDQRFGVNYIIDILRGANTDRIRQFGHDQLPTYGLLQEHGEAELRDYVYQLIGQGVLAQENLVLSSGRTAPIIKFTKDSLAVLKGRSPVRLVQIIHKSASEARKTRGDEVSWEGVDHELFDALRGLRKQVAGERGVPPYVIFSDATLRELARMRPTKLENFRLVYGVGERKLKDLGEKFMAFVADHCRAKGLKTDVMASAFSGPAVAATVKVGSSRPNPEKSRAFEMFRQGASVDDVAAQINRAQSTTSEYLLEFVVAEKPASIAPWVSQGAYRDVVAMRSKLKTERLKPIFIELEEKVPYDQIRLILAHLGTRGTA